MKNFTIVLLLVCAAVAPVAAQSASSSQIVPVGLQAADGVYVLTVADGQVVSVAPLPIISPDSPSPTPRPNPQPVPTVLTPQQEAFKAAALKASTDPDRQATAQNLAAAFEVVAQKIDSGDLASRETIALAVKLTINGLLRGKTQPATEAWEPLREAIGNQFDALAQAGGSHVDYADCLTDVCIGLRASAPNAPDQIDLATILLIVEMIIEILKNLPF